MNEHVQAATSAPLFDPLAPEFIRDPYPHYARLRTTDPMHLTPLGMYVASRHAEASLVLRDKRFGKNYVERTMRRYGPDIMKEPVFRNFSHTMLQQDPRTTRLRPLVRRYRPGSRTCARAFSRSSTRRSTGSFPGERWT